MPGRVPGDELSVAAGQSRVPVVVQLGIAQCELSAQWETLRALGDKRRKALTPADAAVGSAALAREV